MSRKVNATYSSDQVKAAFRVFEATAPPGYVRSDTEHQGQTHTQSWC